MRTLKYVKDETVQRIKILGISDLDYKVFGLWCRQSLLFLTAARCTRSSVT